MQHSLLEIAIAFGPQLWTGIAGMVFLAPMVLAGMVRPFFVLLPLPRRAKPLGSARITAILCVATVLCWIVPLGRIPSESFRLIFGFACFTAILTILTSAMIQSWIKHAIRKAVVPQMERFEAAVSPERPLPSRDRETSQPAGPSRPASPMQHQFDRGLQREDVIRWAPVAAGTAAIGLTGPVLRLLGFVQHAAPGLPHDVAAGMQQTGLGLGVSLASGAVAALATARFVK